MAIRLMTSLEIAIIFPYFFLEKDQILSRHLLQKSYFSDKPSIQFFYLQNLQINLDVFRYIQTRNDEQQL